MPVPPSVGRMVPPSVCPVPFASARRVLLGLLLGLLSLPAAADLQPQGLAFSYQGRLTLAGEPVHGTRTLTFRLFDAASDGDVHGELTLPDVAVTAGLFVVDLDFGAGVFLGQQLWLEVGIDDQVLLPRQRINSTPYALYALEGNVGPVGPAGPEGPQGPKGDPATLVSGNGIAVSGEAASGLTIGMSGDYTGTLSVSADLDVGGDVSVGGTATTDALNVQGGSDLGTNVRMPIYFNEWNGGAPPNVMLAYCDVGDILIGGGCHKNGTSVVISKMQYCSRGDTSTKPLITTNASCINLGPTIIVGGSGTIQPPPAQDNASNQAFWLCAFAATDTGNAFAQATCLRSFQ